MIIDRFIRADDGFLAFVCCLISIFGEGLLEITNLYPNTIGITGCPFVDFGIASSFIPIKSNISIHELPKGKLFVFQPDKKTLAYVFDDCAQLST
jgi:hypothetical protein